MLSTQERQRGGAAAPLRLHVHGQLCDFKLTPGAKQRSEGVVEQLDVRLGDLQLLVEVRTRLLLSRTLLLL